MKTISFYGIFATLGCIMFLLYFWTVANAQDTGVDLQYSTHAMTDITLSSATVSWVTNQEVGGNWVEVKKVGSDSVLFFEDEFGIPSYTHVVSIVGLLPETDYLYRFGSGDNVWDNAGGWYPFRSGKFLGAVQPSNLAGSIVNSKGEPVHRAIVRVRFQRPGWPASLRRTLLTNHDGDWWTVPNDILAPDGEYYYPAEGDRVIVEYQVNYWSGSVDSSHVYTGNSIEILPEVAIKVVDPTKGTKGDIDNDGAVNIFDLLEMLQLMIGDVTPDVIQEFAADLNDDGNINVLDLLQLLQMLSSGQEA